MSSTLLASSAEVLVGGKYRLLDVIGSGGVGTVYRAMHVWTEREVAVKVLDRDLAHLSELREAFLREARAAVRLRHPNVVDVLDMGEDQGDTTYIVMELLSGPTLRDVLHKRGTLSPNETVAVLAPLLDALENAHQLGIVHRDFKPENIILQVDMEGLLVPTLLDFGIAQTIWESQPTTDDEDEVLVGTPQYMSPEQALNRRALIGPQSDVWGVGVVWYECVTGRCPFDGETHADVLRAVCESPLELAEVPDAHRGLLEGMLRRSVSERTQNLSIVRAQMARAGINTDICATSELLQSRPTRRSERIHATLHGVGPHAMQSLSLSVPDVPDLPYAPALEASEPEELPQSSSRFVPLAGAALVAVIALAALWVAWGPTSEATVSEPAAPAVVEPTAVATRPAEPASPVLEEEGTTYTDVLQQPVAAEETVDRPDTEEGPEAVSESEPADPSETAVAPKSADKPETAAEPSSVGEPETAVEPKTPDVPNAAKEAETRNNRKTTKPEKRTSEPERSAASPKPQTPKPAKKKPAPKSDATFDRAPSLVTEW